MVNLPEIAQHLLLAAKTQEPTDSLTAMLTNIPESELERQMAGDDEKKAFWIDVYNAYTQIILRNGPDKYNKRSRFFGSRQINIAGRLLSLDDIEHGILRRSKVKWGLGYINKLFPGAFERRNRVQKVDYRIHFTLNCGAASCPPIAFYKPDGLGKQLDMATAAYLHGEAEYNDTTNTVAAPALMSWFRGDFGGKKKMKMLFKKLKIVPEDKNPRITFKKYNWHLYLENFKNEI